MMPAPSEAAGRLCLVVALRAEAEPLIEHFKLKPAAASRPLRTFAADDERTLLLVTGIGKEAARAAVSRLGDRPDFAWLNVGIAGHRAHRLGTAFLAHRVLDDRDRRAWYPPLVFQPSMPTASVRTVDRACRDYPTDDIYDMEAAGFYAAAARRARHELVHCVKVISDNLDHPASGLTAARVSELVRSSLPLIAPIADTLRGLATDQQRERELRLTPAGFDSLRAGAHFTTTQRRRLRRLLRRFAALHPDTDVLEWITGAEGDTASDVIARLESHLDEHVPQFEERS